MILFAIIAIWLTYYLISPLFIEIEVQEEAPEAIISEDSETESSEELVFDIVDTPGHEAEGTVRIIETESGLVARYENFSTVNGPNLHVYIAKDLEANEYIDLGPIKGTSGNFNYEIPEDTDLSEYRYIMY